MKRSPAAAPGARLTTSAMIASIAAPGQRTRSAPFGNALVRLAAESILREAAIPGRLLVVAENHSIVGGLGEAVAGLLLRSGIAPAFRQIGLPDAFLDAGALPTLHDRYGISAPAVAQAVKGWL